MNTNSSRPASNTLDMLRLVHLGNEYGFGFDYLRAMQTEVFSGNDAAFAPDTLVCLGERLGIPAEAVRADHEQAMRLGAAGVPFTVLGERLGIPGTVSVAQYTAALDKAREQLHG